MQFSTGQNGVGMFALMVLIGWGAVTHETVAQNTMIYSCVDAQGRTLTSDRPNIGCIDREQRILGGATAHEVGVLPPSYTEEERAEQRKQEQARQELIRADRDTRQRIRTLRTRYPDRAAHERSRIAAKEQIEAVINGAREHLKALHSDQEGFNRELDFYHGDIRKAPPKLRLQLENNKKDIEEQTRYIESQEQEKSRIDALYDADLPVLNAIWAGRVPE